MDCDIAIIGGGPVGASLALALKESGLNIYVLEAKAPSNAAPDPRALALSYGSRLLLDRLGVWSRIPEMSSIRTIHISQKQSLGRAVLRAAELDVPELGYVLPYHALHGALQERLSASGVHYLTGASVTDLQTDHDFAAVAYAHGGGSHTLRARLAVVADGGKLLEARYPPALHDYNQSAVIAHVACTRPLRDTAFERFTRQGPVALLPYRDGFELVWTASHEKAAEMLAWSDEVFLANLHQHFGDRVGAFTGAGTRSAFPLRLKRAPSITLPRTVLLGNAAQTLHPVAGQGFNMGLRDAWELAQVILRHAPEDPGTEPVLAAYRKSRQLDRNAGSRFTDSLVKLFSNDMPIVNGGRAAALSLLDCAPFAKRFVARRMMFGANG
jgi:2-octaprenyl-6-methoxyphenol hydroxylase